MVDEIIELVFILRLTVIIIDIILFSIMVKKTLKIELEITKKYFTGVSIFFLVHTICRTFYFLGNFAFPDQPIYSDIGTILGLFSVVVIVAAIESTIYTKSKHIITVYGLCGLSVMIIGAFVDIEFAGLSLMRWAQYLTIPMLAVFIISIYFNVWRKSSGNVRKNALLMTLGILVFCLGEMGNTPTAGDYIPGAIYIAPVAMIVGLIMVFFSVINYFKED